MKNFNLILSLMCLTCVQGIASENVFEISNMFLKNEDSTLISPITPKDLFTEKKNEELSKKMLEEEKKKIEQEKYAYLKFSENMKNRLCLITFFSSNIFVKINKLIDKVDINLNQPSKTKFESLYWMTDEDRKYLERIKHEISVLSKIYTKNELLNFTLKFSDISNYKGNKENKLSEMFIEIDSDLRELNLYKERYSEMCKHRHEKILKGELQVYEEE